MCATCCAGGTEAMCPPCRQRTGIGAFPYHRDDFSFDRLWAFTFEQWKKQWVMLSVAALALGGVYVAGAVVMNIVLTGGTAALSQGGARNYGALAGMMSVLFIGYFVLMLVLGVGFIGFMRMCSDALLGKTVDISVLFSQFSKLGRALAMLLILGGIVLIPIIVIGGVIGVGAAIVIPLMAKGASGGGGGLGVAEGLLMVLGGFAYLGLIVGIVWISLPFTFCMYELAHSDAGAVECVRRGYALSKGFRLPLLGYRLLSGVLIMAGAVACCVGMLPAMALAYMLEAALYLAVRNGSGLPPFKEPTSY
jgi:hypothetical protein